MAVVEVRTGKRVDQARLRVEAGDPALTVTHSDPANPNSGYRVIASAVLTQAQLSGFVAAHLPPASTEATELVPAPVLVAKTDANLPAPVAAGVWADLDPGGTAAARPLDVVIPNVKAGQWVSLAPQMHCQNQATNLFFDVAVMVGGAVAHLFSDFPAATVQGLMAWFAPTGVAVSLGTPVAYQVQAADIENGAIRLRLRCKNGSATARTILASGGFHFRLEGRGPF